MKKSIRYIILSQMLVGLATHAYASGFVGIGLQSGQTELGVFKAQLEKNMQQVSILNDRTGKFENDNSFVQLYNPKYNTTSIRVVNRDVFIAFPSRMNYDSLMEALIKIRAARTFGANQVYVSCEPLLKEIVIEGELGNELNLEELVSAAGADFVNERNSLRSLSEAKPVRNSVNQSDYWIGGSNHPSLLGQIAHLLGKKAYSFKELSESRDQLKGRKIYWVAAATPPVNDNYFITLAQIRWLEQQGASVHLISPYLPYARSDKPEFDVGVTTQGRLAADLIEAVGTQGITVVRAHAPQSLGFFKIHSNEISGRSTIIDYLKSQQVECVIAPDAGFQKDATKYQHELSKAYGGSKPVCLAVMNKERNSDGKESILGGTGLDRIAGKQIVIIDDETATGGTLSQVAQIVQEYHPKSVFAVVTHLAGPAQKSLNSEYIHKLVVTDTLPVNLVHQKLTVLSIAPEIAAEISQAESNR